MVWITNCQSESIVQSRDKNRKAKLFIQAYLKLISRIAATWNTMKTIRYPRYPRAFSNVEILRTNNQEKCRRAIGMKDHCQCLLTRDAKWKNQMLEVARSFKKFKERVEILHSIHQMLVGNRQASSFTLKSCPFVKFLYEVHVRATKPKVIGGNSGTFTWRRYALLPSRAKPKLTRVQL